LPETAEQRLAIADEIVTLADQVADNERAAAGRLYRVIANMELVRVDDAERELDIIAEQAVRLRQPAQLWMATSSRANVALFRGRFDDARTLIEEALALGERAQRRDAVLSHRLQTFLLHRETGGSADIEALIDEAVSAFPTRPVFRCALSYIHSQLGNVSRSRAEVDDLAARDFAAIRRRLNASNADEVATGAVSRTLGVLASVLSRWDEAVRHFDAAAAHNQRMGARPWLAHTQHDYAKMLLARDMPGDRGRAQHLLHAATEQYGARDDPLVSPGVGTSGREPDHRPHDQLARVAAQIRTATKLERCNLETARRHAEPPSGTMNFRHEVRPPAKGSRGRLRAANRARHPCRACHFDIAWWRGRVRRAGVD
jgi:hypothetical protein